MDTEYTSLRIGRRTLKRLKEVIEHSPIDSILKNWDEFFWWTIWAVQNLKESFHGIPLDELLEEDRKKGVKE